MSNPSLIIETSKLRHNVKTVVKMCKASGIEICAVTKACCAHHKIAEVFAESGAGMLADSRVQNLKQLSSYSVPKMMLRLPMISEADDVVRYCDVSLNSELNTVKALSEAVVKLNKQHGVVIMIELGDLREGIPPEEALTFAEEAIKLPGVNLTGVGVNFNCYGGVIPDEENLNRLADVASNIEEKLGIKLQIISGGNSGSLYLLKENKMPAKINNLRLGESILLGMDTSFQKQIEDLYTDVFTLKAEVIEMKEKPSVPSGNIGLNAFGQKTSYVDNGVIRRVILACGRQDLPCDQLIPNEDGVKYLGSSSDHMILDITQSDKDYAVGDIVTFNLSYGALVGAFTSRYIDKIFI